MRNIPVRNAKRTPAGNAEMSMTEGRGIIAVTADNMETIENMEQMEAAEWEEEPEEEIDNLRDR